MRSCSIGPSTRPRSMILQRGDELSGKTMSVVVKGILSISISSSEDILSSYPTEGIFSPSLKSIESFIVTGSFRGFQFFANIIA